MGIYTNGEGLNIHYGPRAVEGWKARTLNTDGAVKELIIDFSYDKLPGFDQDAGGGTTYDSFSGLQAYIPAGSWIMSATLICTSDWGGTTPTLTIGTYRRDGTVIDADGIDATIAEAAMDDGDVVLCDGAQVGGTATVGAYDAYIVAATGGTVTSGAARLVVRYIQGE